MSVSRVTVIGGGAAGIFAAARAASLGADTLLLEKGSKLARKLRISGKGRGNITNTADLPDFIEAFSPNGKFLYGAFSRFFRDDLLELLAGLGVPTKVERGGRVFPASDRAADVVEALERWMNTCGARVRLNTRARGIRVSEGRATGVECYGGAIPAGAVILASGGASYPRTGSTGDGYAMAREVGHSIIAPRPALSALTVREPWIGRLQGLSLRNVQSTLMVKSGDDNWTRARSEFGEMVFTSNGISGPIILTLSRAIRDSIGAGVAVSIDLKPALTAEQVSARLVRDFVSTKHFANYLPALLPRLLIDVFVELVGIPAGKVVNAITAAERMRIVGLLKDFRVAVTGLGPLEEAIVTAGGVPIAEIDPRTMMSKLVKGLFFAGEVINIDAETGGYNLQAAFSTGYVAGEAAASFASAADD